MSPKKRKRHPHQRPGQTTGTASPQPAAPAPTRGISRTPVIVKDPPDRRTTPLWVALTVLWALGTPLALANLLFTAMSIGEAAQQTDPAGPTGGPAAPGPTDAVNDLGTALIWLLVLALLVPAASAVTALVLRRKIAAIGFTTALTASAIPLFMVMPPAELWQALTHHFGP